MTEPIVIALEDPPMMKTLRVVGEHRAERRRAKMNPECMPQYRRYAGWEY